MKQGLVRLLYNFGKRFIGRTLHIIMCVLLCYPVSIRIYYQQGVLFLVSFKKGQTSDIKPASLSSWLKQTILLCYKQADQQALDLVQVKAHDIMAFVPSKAFYSGVSMDQIMQACHWKAHNTFTNYLKDLTRSDNDHNMHLGPVVTAQAQQVPDPSPQTSYPRNEKKGGAHPLQPSLQESKYQGLGI